MFKNEIKKTRHFNERVAERFQRIDGLSEKQIRRTIEKAVEKGNPGEKVKYTHPAFKITVVIRKIGRHGADLITCWREDAV